MSSQVEHKQARIAENGELTIPAEFRDELGLTPGATVMLVRVGGTLLLIPENTELEAALDRMSDFFKTEASRKPTSRPSLRISAKKNSHVAILISLTAQSSVAR